VPSSCDASEKGSEVFQPLIYYEEVKRRRKRRREENESLLEKENDSGEGERRAKHGTIVKMRERRRK